MFHPLSKDIRSNNHVRGVALQIVDGNEPDRLPLLADALEEAGCTDEILLSCCRRNVWHSVLSPALIRVLAPRQPRGQVIPDWDMAFKAMGLKPPSLHISSKMLRKFAKIWPIPMTQEVTCDLVIAAMKNQDIEVYNWWGGSLDERIRNHESSIRPEYPYLIGVAASVEAGPEFANLSQQDLLAQGHQGMRLQERLFLGLAYFFGAKLMGITELEEMHVDRDTVTQCPGSLNAVGFVPGMYWDPVYRRVHVDWDGPRFAYPNLRSRPVVSLPVKPTVWEAEQAIA